MGWLPVAVKILTHAVSPARIGHGEACAFGGYNESAMMLDRGCCTTGDEMFWVLSMLVVVVFTAGCSDGVAVPDDRGAAGSERDATVAEEADFPNVSCTVAYREDMDESPTTEQVALTPGDAETLDHEALRLTLAYHFDVGEGGDLVVEGADRATGSVFARDLYQFVVGQPPRNAFEGGHGFTGLNYLYPPGTTAEGQFFCEVQEPA